MSRGRRNNRRGQRHGGNKASGNPSQSTAPADKRVMTPVMPVFEHRFNDDLLISEHDQQLARTEYAEIYHVLDHPELREQFLLYDHVANEAKLWVHRMGLLAVLLAALALLGS